MCENKQEMPNMQHICLQITTDMKLVAEINPDPDYKEIFIGIEETKPKY